MLLKKPRSNILELILEHIELSNSIKFVWIDGHTWILTLCETQSAHFTWNNPKGPKHLKNFKLFVCFEKCFGPQNRDMRLENHDHPFPWALGKSK